MAVPMYRVISGVALAVIIVVFFGGLTHVRIQDCERRRLAIIEAANLGRSDDMKLTKETLIAYSPGELLKKVADPVGYEEQLIRKLREGKASVLQPKIVQEIIINEQVYMDNKVLIQRHTEDILTLRENGVFDSPANEQRDQQQAADLGNMINETKPTDVQGKR